MKNKASLMLMEQTLMILVLALSAALCLGIFSEAWRISDRTIHREEGAFLAQNAAQLLKCGVSAEQLALPEGYTLEVQPVYQDIPGLGRGIITVFWEEEEVFSLETGWQEVLP